jgi:hypothetical protein
MSGSVNVHPSNNFRLEDGANMNFEYRPMENGNDSTCWSSLEMYSTLSSADSYVLMTPHSEKKTFSELLDGLSQSDRREIQLAIHEALYDINFEKRLEFRRRKEQDTKWLQMKQDGIELSEDEMNRILTDRLKVDDLFKQRETNIIEEVIARYEVKLLLNGTESASSILKRLRQTHRIKIATPLLTSKTSTLPSNETSPSLMLLNHEEEEEEEEEVITKEIEEHKDLPVDDWFSKSKETLNSTMNESHLLYSTSTLMEFSKPIFSEFTLMTPPPPSEMTPSYYESQMVYSPLSLRKDPYKQKENLSEANQLSPITLLSPLPSLKKPIPMASLIQETTIIKMVRREIHNVFFLNNGLSF